MRALAQGILALVLAGVLGCSLLVDTSDLDSGCPEGTKNCPGEGCVRISDPAYGCTFDSCTPCENLTNAAAVCFEFECIRFCLEGYGCDGCLVNKLTDEKNCGECNKLCAEGDVCKEGVCTPPFE